MLTKRDLFLEWQSVEQAYDDALDRRLDAPPKTPAHTRAMLDLYWLGVSLDRIRGMFRPPVDRPLRAEDLRPVLADRAGAATFHRPKRASTATRRHVHHGQTKRTRSAVPWMADHD